MREWRTVSSGDRLIWEISQSDQVEASSLPCCYSYILNSFLGGYGEDLNRAWERVDRVLELISVSRLDLRPVECSVRHLRPAHIKIRREHLREILKRNCSNKDVESFELWAGGGEQDCHPVFLPSTADGLNRHRQMTSEEIQHKILEPIFGSNLEEISQKVVRLIQDIYSRLGVADFSRKLTLSILPYGDCLLLGTIFLGLTELFSRKNFTVDIVLGSLFEDEVIPRGNLAFGYATVEELHEHGPMPDDLILGSGVMAFPTRDRGLPARPIIQNSRQRFARHMSYFSLLDKYMRDRILIKSPSGSNLKVGLSAVNDRTARMVRGLFGHAHLLALLQASSVESCDVLIPTPDLYVWGREAGLLDWDLVPQLGKSRLRSLDALDSSETTAELSAQVVFFSGYDKGLESRSVRKKQVADVTEVLKLVRSIVDSVLGDLREVLGALTQSRCHTSKRSELYRDAILTTLYQADPNYTGVLQLLSSRGLLHNVCEMEHYDMYKPIAALQLEDLLRSPHVGFKDVQTSEEAAS